MALVLEHSGENSGTGVTELDIGAPTLEAGELLTVLCSISGNKTATVTMGSLTLTEIDSQNQGGTQGVTIQAYRGISGTQITGQQINIDQGSTSAINGRYEIRSGADQSGTNGSGAIEVVATPTTGSDDSPSVSVTPLSNDADVIGLIAHESNDFTESSSFTDGAQNLRSGAGSFVTALSTGYTNVATPSSTTYNGILDASENWAALAFVIKPAGGVAEEGSISLGIDQGISGAGMASAGSGLSLTHDLDDVPGAGAAGLAITQLDGELGYSALATAVTQGILSLSHIQQLNNAGLAQSLSGLQLSINQTIQLATGGAVAASISLGHDLAVSPTGEGQATAVLSFPLSLFDSVAGQATAVAGVQLGQDLAASIVASAMAGAGLSLDVLQSVTVAGDDSGTPTVFVTLTLRERNNTLSLESRTNELGLHPRSDSLTLEDRE